MFERLFEFIEQFVDILTPFIVIDEYEEGVVLTFGKFRERILEPGFHWKWPLIDKVLFDNVVSSTRNLTNQTLTTKDGKSIVLGAMIRWRIRDIVKATIRTEDVDGVLDDVTYGVLAKAVRCTNWESINDGTFVDEVFREARARAFRFGIEIEELQLTDLAITRVFRLVGE